MTEELKPLPCPWCNGEPRFFKCPEHDKWNIYCLNIDCGVRPSLVDWVSRDRILKVWNTRSPAWRDDMSEAPKDQRTIEAWHRQHQCVISIFWMPDDKAVTQMGRVLNWHEKTLTHAWPEEAFSHWRLPLPPEEKA